MNTIKNTIADVWDSLLGRTLLIGCAVGWVPFYLLTMAHAALTK